MQWHEQDSPASVVPAKKHHFQVRPLEVKQQKYSPKIFRIRLPEEQCVASQSDPLFTPCVTLAAFKTFDEWLEDGLGKEVQQRIFKNRHSVDMESVASYFDTVEDIQQKALIWLWQTWQHDPDFVHLTQNAHSLSHKAGILTKIAVRGGRCMYAKRRREGREAQADLCFDDGEEWLPFVLMSPDSIRATNLDQHDRMVTRSDRHMDVWAAIELVVLRMMAEQSKRAKRNGKTAAIEHITRTIIEGYMHHYTDRYNQTGTFRKFCEARGVSRHQIARWRPLIFQYLQEELAIYSPMQVTVKSLPNILAAAAD